MRKIGELWRQMSEDEKAKWLVDGEAEPTGHPFNLSRKTAKRRAVQSNVTFNQIANASTSIQSLSAGFPSSYPSNSSGFEHLHLGGSSQLLSGSSQFATAPNYATSHFVQGGYGQTGFYGSGFSHADYVPPTATLGQVPAQMRFGYPR
uniref:Uncharacterized protein n=1 Tax=Hanusia phi TaxID=3032 RepID=A0A7S0EB09_9CRYP